MSVTARLPWPASGLSDRVAYSRQDEFTTPDCANVRGYEPTTGRLRGGSRAGHSKYVSAQINGSNAVQLIDHITVGSAVSVAGVRTIYNVAVAGGNVALFTSSGVTTATAGTAALATTPYLGGSELFGTEYFADGTNWKKWTAATNTVAAWTASAGTLPASGANTPRLICTWRGRIVLAGLVGDDQNWFMSASGDASDFNYGAFPYLATSAVSGNDAPCGKVGDMITALIPFSDDVLLIGGDHTLYQFSNDPADGGSIDRISDQTGIAFGSAWCQDPEGRVYFWGSRGGLWRMRIDEFPERLSQAVDSRVGSIDLSTTAVKLAWDDAFQSVMVYCTPLDGTAGVHYCYDVRSEAWYRDTFASNGHQPRSVHVLDGDLPGDRVLLLGCGDGYIRKIDTSAHQDDGQVISSYVFFGPVRTRDDNGFLLNELSLTVGSASGANLAYSVQTGITAAAALAATPTFSGVWPATRRYVDRNRANGSHLYVKLSLATLGEGWQYEAGDLELLRMGANAGRKFR